MSCEASLQDAPAIIRPCRLTLVGPAASMRSPGTVSTTSLLRSVLFVPGTRPDRFAKALAAGADGVILDLEDSVDPGRKAEARDAVVAFLREEPETRGQLFVRVNTARSSWIDDDVVAVGELAGLDGVVLPKAESAGEVEAVAKRVRSRRVLPLLETARGVVRADAIAAADAEVPAIMFGAEDLTAELGIPRTLEGEEIVYARSRVVLAAAVAGADPLDAVFGDLEAPEQLRRDCDRARALGFRGKMAIHPNQIAVIHEVFTPTAEEIAAARQLLETFEARAVEGVIRTDGQMVDAPMLARARRVLALADAAGQ
jgi:citrate lyase subunit beta/citryl-CoA lyase